MTGLLAGLLGENRSREALLCIAVANPVLIRGRTMSIKLWTTAGLPCRRKAGLPLWLARGPGFSSFLPQSQNDAIAIGKPLQLVECFIHDIAPAKNRAPPNHPAIRAKLRAHSFMPPWDLIKSVRR
jgi:hypothetical protein